MLKHSFYLEKSCWFWTWIGFLLIMLSFFLLLIKLGAEDGDTSAGNITFVISGGVSGRGSVYGDYNGGRNGLGFLSYRTKPESPIIRFTQDDLVKKRVIFTHTGTVKRHTFYVVNDCWNFSCDWNWLTLIFFLLWEKRDVNDGKPQSLFQTFSRIIYCYSSCQKNRHNFSKWNDRILL